MNASKLKKLIPAGAVTSVLAASFLVLPNLPASLASCGTASLGAAPAQPQEPGTTITFTASAGCGGYGGGAGYGYLQNVPRFRFWELDPGSRWSMVQDYSASNTYTWNTKSTMVAGNYNFEVDVRSADESSSVPYDVVAHNIYHLGIACTNALLTNNPVSGTGHTGGSVLMTGSSSTCPNARYRFWIRDPGSRWSMVQDYSATTTHTWGPVGTYHVGQYSMEVDVRDTSSGSAAYDVVDNVTYNLAGCTGATITATPSSGTHGAGNITLSATATCPGTATFRFWIQDPGSRWSMVQNFGTSNTYTWAAGNQKAGTSHIEVDVRDQGSLDVYEFATSPQNVVLS